MSLNNKVAVVTGASKGIGLAIARGLANRGAKVMISSRDATTISDAAQSLRDEGLEVQSTTCNMGHAEQIGAMAEHTLSTYGAIDVVVNNAAINPSFGPTLKTSPEIFDKIMNVNVKGPLELIRCTAPHLIQRGGGSIINIASTAGIKPWPGIGIYSVSKSAVIQLSKVLSIELGPKGIRVNTICPGLIKTKLSRALWTNDAIREKLIAETPTRRIGEPEDVTGLAVFLASDDSAHMTGGVFTVDGGMT